jgi:hypothetical protein
VVSGGHWHGREDQAPEDDNGSPLDRRNLIFTQPHSVFSFRERPLNRSDGLAPCKLLAWLRGAEREQQRQGGLQADGFRPQVGAPRRKTLSGSARVPRLDLRLVEQDHVQQGLNRGMKDGGILPQRTMSARLIIVGGKLAKIRHRCAFPYGIELSRHSRRIVLLSVTM